jgi:hypothetical protein
MDLENIKKKIRYQGVKRIAYEPFVFKTALKWFTEIADEMLIRKDEKFDYDLVKNVVDFIICWTYLQGENIDFNKGFLIKGLTGRGKSFLLRVWKYFIQIDKIKFLLDGEQQPMSPVFVNVKKISGEYQNPVSGGYPVISKYSKMHCLILDDIGKEPDKSANYSNSINVVEEIINNREESGLLTFGTTNFNSLKDIYDDRTISRMNKLFTPISMNHKIDFRITPNVKK